MTPFDGGKAVGASARPLPSPVCRSPHLTSLPLPPSPFPRSLYSPVQKPRNDLARKERKNHLPLRSSLYLQANDLSRWEGVEELSLLLEREEPRVNSMREISSLGGSSEGICVKRVIVSPAFRSSSSRLGRQGAETIALCSQSISAEWNSNSS